MYIELPNLDSFPLEFTSSFCILEPSDSKTDFVNLKDVFIVFLYNIRKLFCTFKMVYFS